MIMHEDNQPPDKRPWRAPEMIDVGGAIDLTHGMGGNVGEGTNPATWQYGTRSQDEEVELEGS